MKRSVIIVLICFIVCGAVAAGAIYIKEKNSVDSGGQNPVSEISELNELESRKNLIEREIRSLKASSDRTALGKGAVSFVCLGAHNKVYDVVYPELKKRDYPGVLVLTEDLFIESVNCMSREQVSELVADGWEISVRFPSESYDPIGDLKKLIADAERLGFEVGSTVYYPMQKYKAECEDDLIDLGFDSAIYHGEGSESVFDAIKPEKPSDGSMWKIYSRGYVLSDKQTFLKQLEDFGGNLAFEISFDSSYLPSYCTDLGIANLLTICNGYDREKVDFTTVSGARLNAESLDDVSREETEKIADEINILEKELDEIEKRIEELRNGFDY